MMHTNRTNTKILAFFHEHGFKAWISEHGDVEVEIPLGSGYPPSVEHASTLREARTIMGY